MADGTTGVGVTDSAPGAGIADVLALLETINGNERAIQLIEQVAMGSKALTLRASLTYTPVLIADTVPPAPVLSYCVPAGKAFIFDGAHLMSPVADENLMRVCRRYLLKGNNAQAAPSALAAPTPTLTAHDAGNTDDGIYSYKVAPIDAFGKEGVISAASSNVTTSAGNRLVSLALAALPTGAVGYRLYRTLKGGAVYYFLDETNATPYLDVAPDADLDQTRTPATTWGVAPTADTPVGTCEAQFECVTALAQAPTRMVYKDERGKQDAITQTPTATAGARSRMKARNEARSFATTPSGITGLYADAKASDFGISSVLGFNIANATIGGQWVVWGLQVLAATRWLTVPAAGAVVGCDPPRPYLFPPGSELIVDLGTTVAAAAGVRDISVFGRLISV